MTAARLAAYPPREATPAHPLPCQLSGSSRSRGAPACLHSPGNQAHQHVVLHCGEELRQVQAHHPSVSSLDVCCRSSTLLPSTPPAPPFLGTRLYAAIRFSRRSTAPYLRPLGPECHRASVPLPLRPPRSRLYAVRVPRAGALATASFPCLLRKLRLLVRFPALGASGGLAPQVTSRSAFASRLLPPSGGDARCLAHPREGRPARGAPPDLFIRVVAAPSPPGSGPPRCSGSRDPAPAHPAR